MNNHLQIPLALMQHIKIRSYFSEERIKALKPTLRFTQEIRQISSTLPSAVSHAGNISTRAELQMKTSKEVNS